MGRYTVIGSGTDCKSVAFGLWRFKSSPAHMDKTNIMPLIVDGEVIGWVTQEMRDFLDEWQDEIDKSKVQKPS